MVGQINWPENGKGISVAHLRKQISDQKVLEEREKKPNTREMGSSAGTMFIFPFPKSDNCYEPLMVHSISQLVLDDDLEQDLWFNYLCT